ncbi:MAG: LuxR C-terminal-related transcriptional regulator, partial [Cyanobacteria bacterium J06626_18]
LKTSSVDAPIPEAKMASVLTNREQEVLQLIIEGFSSQEIADRLFLSFGTIKSHVRMILSKVERSAE